MDTPQLILLAILLMILAGVIVLIVRQQNTCTVDNVEGFREKRRGRWFNPGKRFKKPIGIRKPIISYTKPNKPDPVRSSNPQNGATDMNMGSMRDFYMNKPHRWVVDQIMQKDPNRDMTPLMNSSHSEVVEELLRKTTFN